MRPELLNSIFKNISTLSGIGPKLETIFNKLSINKIVHLFWHIPYNIIKRDMHENINDLYINSIITIKVNIIEHQPSRFKRQPYKVKCNCNDISIDLVFFNAKHPFIKSSLPIGEKRFISGKLEHFRSSYQIVHPTHIIKTDNINEIKSIEPIYGLTAGLSQKIYIKTSKKVWW